MFRPHRTHPQSDIAAAFREGVGRLERPERRQAEAARLRMCLGRTKTRGLLERMRPEGSVSTTRAV